MTRFWAEQVIMAQLQGSTESWSQLPSTPRGSTSPCRMAISACTARGKARGQAAETNQPPGRKKKPAEKCMQSGAAGWRGGERRPEGVRGVTFGVEGLGGGGEQGDSGEGEEQEDDEAAGGGHWRSRRNGSDGGERRPSREEKEKCELGLWEGRGGEAGGRA